MSNQNRSQNFRPTQREIDDVTKRSQRGALKGTLAGGVAGALVGAKSKNKLIGTAIGATAGNLIGRRIGRREGAQDVVKSRQALLQNMSARLDFLEERQFDRMGNAMEPGTSGQHPVPNFPNAKGPFSPGDGLDDEGRYTLTEERQRLAELFGWGIVSALEDSELSEENCLRLRNQVLGQQAQTGSPSAGVRLETFERAELAKHMGARAVEAMGPAEVRAIYLSATRKGMIEFSDQNDFAILNRERNGDGQFVDNEAVSSQAIQRAYHKTDRKTGIEATGAGLAAGAGLATAIAHLRGRKVKRPRLTAGSVPQLGFAANDEGHPVRNTVAGVGAGALGIAGLLSLRKRRQLRLPPGVPKLPPRTSKPSFDVETQVMSRRLPFLTRFAMGHASAYPIKRRALRGKKPPTHVHPRHLGKAKKHALAFLIQDDDFPLVPQQDQKLPPGARRRLPLAKSKTDVLKRLKAITALSREFGIGSIAAEGIVDAVGLGGATTPKKRKVTVDSRGNVLAPPQQLTEPGMTSTSSFASAVARLHEFGFGPVAGRLAAEGGVIAGADLTAEEIHDALSKARKRKKQKALGKGGIEQETGVPGNGPTSLSLRATLNEFAVGRERMDKSRRDGTTVASAGAGGIAGAIGGLRYESGTPVSAKDLRPGDKIHKRFGPGGILEHQGVVGSDGRVTHRTRGSANYRSVQASTFAKTGRGPIYREKPSSNDLPRKQAASNASSAAGTRAGKYCAGTNSCQTAVGRLASKGRPSGQLRRAGVGAAIGAAGAGTVAAILNRRKDSHGKR